MSIYIQQRTWVVDILSHCVWKQNIGCPCCDQFLVLVMPLKYFIWMIQQITTVCFLFKSCCSKEYKNTKKDTFNLVTFFFKKKKKLSHLSHVTTTFTENSSRYCACKAAALMGHWKFGGMGMCLRPLHIECMSRSAVVITVESSFCRESWKIQFVASASRLAV